MDRHLLIYLVIITLFISPSTPTPANILIWGAVNTQSIRLSMTPFIEALANKGHNVTYITVVDDFDHEPLKKSKVNNFIPPKWKESMGSWESDDISFNDVRKTLIGVQKGCFDIRSMGVQACESLYSDPVFQEWVKQSPKYDLVVVETLVNECAYGLVHLWNSKLVIYSTTTIIPGFPDAHGLPDESSSISFMNMGLPTGNEMSFIQRFANALNPILFSLTKEYFYFPQLEEITRRGWKSMGIKEDVPSFAEVERNTSLVVITSHISTDYPRSLPPNVVQIGGGVVTKKQKPLSNEMENFLNSGKDGFIYISFGTVVDFTKFDEQTQIDFIEGLKQFPNVKFLWRSPVEIKRELPANVRVESWVPQQTILAHPKIKAFITHAGMGGITEAIHFSVPMICIPVLADQDNNCRVIELRNAAIRLELIELDLALVHHSISEILSNPRYQDGITRLTRISKDRPMPPVQNAVWWVEYILRHENSNEFLLPPSAHQAWWKRRQIDVWTVATILVMLITFIPIYFIRWLLCKKVIYKPHSDSHFKSE